MPAIRFPRSRIVGYRLEVLSSRTMEWTTAYEAAGKLYSHSLCDAVMGQAIKDPEVLEIKLLQTYDHEIAGVRAYDEPKPIAIEDVPKLEEPRVVQHVRLRWRLGRA